VVFGRENDKPLRLVERRNELVELLVLPGIVIECLGEQVGGQVGEVQKLVRRAELIEQRRVKFGHAPGARLGAAGADEESKQEK
jgi:hypothetical protein